MGSREVRTMTKRGGRERRKTNLSQIDRLWDLCEGEDSERRLVENIVRGDAFTDIEKIYVVTLWATLSDETSDDVIHWLRREATSQ